MIAANRGRELMVDSLLNRQDINLNATNHAGQTALDIAQSGGNLNIMNNIQQHLPLRQQLTNVVTAIGGKVNPQEWWVMMIFCL